MSNKPNHPDDEPKVKSVTCLSCGAEIIPSTIAYHHTFFHKTLDNVQYRINGYYKR